MESMGRVRLTVAYARTVSFDGLAIIGFKPSINKTESQEVPSVEIVDIRPRNSLFSIPKRR